MEFETISWKELKADFPLAASAILAEYNLRNGFIPYEHGYVYVIQACGTSYFKIGKTTNPDKRILQIAPQMPFPTRYVKVWPSDFMSMGERLLHESYQRIRTNGEWFDFQDPADLFDLLSYFGTPNRVKYAYANSFSRLIYQSLDSQKEMTLLNKRLDIDADIMGGFAIAIIGRLFDEIREEVAPPLHEDIQVTLDSYASYVFSQLAPHEQESQS